MVAVNVLKFPISTPADVTPLNRLREAGYDASQILAVVGKTEGESLCSDSCCFNQQVYTVLIPSLPGNGCVNDFSRTLASVVWESRIPQNAVTIFSGGTEGVLSPHVTFLVREEHDTGLVGVVGHTRIFAPHEVGSPEQGRQVAATVAKMMHKSSISSQDVHLVLVKCPLLTSQKLEAIRAEGQTPTTTGTYESMAKSRYASALGIAIALGEMPEAEIESQMVSEKAWSSKASCSSGAELEDCRKSLSNSCCALRLYESAEMFCNLRALV